MKKRPFDLRYLPAFPNMLSYCIESDVVKGGTIAQYLPRLTIGGPAKGIKYGMSPIIQVYLDGKPLDRGFSNMAESDLSYY
jgi:hypothetical protein